MPTESTIEYVGETQSEGNSELGKLRIRLNSELGLLRIWGEHRILHLKPSYSTGTCWFLEFEFYCRVEAFLVCTCGSTSGGSKLCLYFIFMLPIFRFLKLNNELKVLLISDVATEKAAAALAVRVGELGLSDQT